MRRSVVQLFRCLYFGLTAWYLPSAYAEENLTPCKIGGQWHDCVKVPLANDEEDNEQKKFIPPHSGFAKVYLVRPEANELKSKSQIYIDEHLVAILGPETYMAVELTPGEHHLTAKTDHGNDMIWSLKEGRTYFLSLDLERSFWNNNEQIRFKHAPEAKDKIAQARLVRLQAGKLNATEKQ
ncbi:DUF2846 domain-containing protein [Undibacterium griseum]|uniref:DUF2846 domain-containing protein n=1 Tax=Undibacterium griseum TaxID=2762295 RepID=A0ABR6YK94_9BURK|nr:DUF2846 domain-containing protein [Undibacterium griseum]MBC3884317.1 DUF2846 domain-containing protein [Undibacterium griseum]